MIEVERKYRIINKNAIAAKLVQLGYKKLKTVRQADKIYLKNHVVVRKCKIGSNAIH